jgi:hypothetical protein
VVQNSPQVSIRIGFAEWARPDKDQEELLECELEIEARRRGGVYCASPEELEGIDLDCRRLGEGRFATDEEVEAVFAKYLRR